LILESGYDTQVLIDFARSTGAVGVITQSSSLKKCTYCKVSFFKVNRLDLKSIEVYSSICEYRFSNEFGNILNEQAILTISPQNIGQSVHHLPIWIF
jgi:hypothetical protein